MNSEPSHPHTFFGHISPSLKNCTKIGGKSELSSGTVDVAAGTFVLGAPAGAHRGTARSQPPRTCDAGLPAPFAQLIRRRRSLSQSTSPGRRPGRRRPPAPPASGGGVGEATPLEPS